jgi:hypothetical protein
MYSITPSRRHLLPRCCANKHITPISFTQVLPPITTLHRYHFPDDVVNNPIISPPITQVLPSTTSVITPSHTPYYPGAVANYHITLRPITQLLLLPIDTLHRHHCPNDVVNSPTTSPPITHILPPIATSDCVLYLRCYRQLPHHIDIISQMM